MFGATMLMSTTFTSCSSEDTTQPKNYYGFKSDDNNGTPKEAYYALFIGTVLLIGFLAWFLKKLSKKN